MVLTPSDIASMIDLSCVRTESNRSDIERMVEAADKYGFGHVSVLQCFVPYTRELLRSRSGVGLVGNVSFPSGSDSTSVKVCQARELVAAGCAEIDMVMNVGLLRSGEYGGVEEDVRAVAAAVYPIPLKVIIEIMLLTADEARTACGMCADAGAAYVKTGTGWASRGTTVEDVRQIKSWVGDRIQIKASGGIRNLSTLADMYRAGARRFGVNLRSGVAILEEASVPGSVVGV